MARYVNIWSEKNVVVRKAYDGDYGHWITEDEFMVAIENDDGSLVMLPVMDSDYLMDCTADEYLKECEDDGTKILLPFDCPARDDEICKNITEWICNEGFVAGSSVVEATCKVVALLARNGMWKIGYSKHIDINRIKEEYGEE